MTAQPPRESSRIQYNAALRQIESDLMRMGTSVLEMVDLATRAALEDEPVSATAVVEREKQIDQMSSSFIERVIVLLAMQAPVAHDLLMLTSAFVMVNELEKIGDEATKLATRVQKLRGTFPYELRELLVETSKLAQSNLRDALRLFSQYESQAAERLILQDDAVDKLYKNSRTRILEMMRERPDELRQLLRCTEVFHALEHVSDHTVDMAKGLRGCYDRHANDV